MLNICDSNSPTPTLCSMHNDFTVSAYLIKDMDHYDERGGAQINANGNDTPPKRCCSVLASHRKAGKISKVR